MRSTHLPRILAVLALYSLFISIAAAQEPKVSASNPQFNALKTLAGEWQMKMPDGKIATETYRVVSGDSAILLEQQVPGESNMITVFHPDGQKTVATHYCSMGNQPRMVADASTNTKEIPFQFKDITNDDGKSGSMKALTVVLVDKDHHKHIWTWSDPSGKQQTETFEYSRVSSVAQGK